MVVRPTRIRRAQGGRGILTAQGTVTDGGPADGSRTGWRHLDWLNPPPQVSRDQDDPSRNGDALTVRARSGDETWRLVPRGTLPPGPLRGPTGTPHLPRRERTFRTASSTAALLVHYAALVDQQTANPATAVGARVRQERQGRGWTLDQLAASAGVSRRALVNVEQGVANPSVGTLLRISDTLGIGLPALVAPPAPRPVRVTHRARAHPCGAGGNGGRGWLVAGTRAAGRGRGCWDWSLAPRGPSRQ